MTVKMNVPAVGQAINILCSYHILSTLFLKEPHAIDLVDLEAEAQKVQIICPRSHN